MKLILRWILLTLSVIASSYICQVLNLGFEARPESVGGFFALMIGVALLAFLNATLGKILKVLTIPLSCITFGLFVWVVNAVVLIVASALNIGLHFTTSGPEKFLAALVASFLIAVINGFLNRVLGDDDKDGDKKEGR